MVRHYILRTLLYCSISGFLLVGIAGGVGWRFKDGLPSFAELEDVEPARTTNIFSRDGTVLKRFWVENRVPIPFDKIPKAAIDG